VQESDGARPSWVTSRGGNPRLVVPNVCTATVFPLKDGRGFQWVAHWARAMGGGVRWGNGPYVDQDQAQRNCLFALRRQYQHLKQHVEG
jgi:hypothetical protein